MRPLVILVLCVVSLGYIWLRSTSAGTSTVSDYSALDQTLHRLALGSAPVAEMTHDIERGMFLKSAPADAYPHSTDGLHGGNLYAAMLERRGWRRDRNRRGGRIRWPGPR